MNQIKMELIKSYKNSILVPSIIVIISSVINSIAHYDPDYESEWMTSEVIDLVSIGLSIGYIIFFSIISLPLLLNKWDKISSNLIYSFLTWFLVPLSFSISIFYHEISNLINNGNTDLGLIYASSLTIPYLAGLALSYFNFHKKHSR